MHLLEFPVELLHRILLHAAISRGVTRALRLKLVCKKFNDCLQPALFESRLLDEFGMEDRFSNLQLMELWYIRKHHGAANIWQSYLAYRVQNETDPEVGRFVEIRQVAEDLCRQTESQYEPTVNSLCWLALERGTCYPGYREGWKSSSRRIGDEYSDPPDPSLNLLSAAAYFGYIPLARQLLSYGHCPTSDNDLFPSPMQLAAWAGNADMLRLFQDYLPEFEDVPPRFVHDDRTWRGKTGPGSIKGAALLGDMTMLRLAVYPPSRSSPDSTDFAGQPFGHVDPQSKPGSDLRAALYFCKTWEAFKFIDSFFKESIFTDSYHVRCLLRQYAELGNVEMVQQLIDASANIHRSSATLNCNPLVIAARYCQEDVVNLLLRQGADPNDGYLQQRGPPLFAAAVGGSMPIIQKLLDHGAKIERGMWDPLYFAARLEHTAMVELLLELTGAEDRSCVLSKVLEDGLDSMAELLRQSGVEKCTCHS